MPGAEGSVSVRGSRRQALRCPDCRLLVTSSVLALSPRHRPRCLAWRRAVVELEVLPSQTAIGAGTRRTGDEKRGRVIWEPGRAAVSSELGR